MSSRVLENLLAMLEAEEDANAKLKRDKTGDREENIKDDHRHSVRIAHCPIYGDGGDRIVKGQFIIKKQAKNPAIDSLTENT